MNGVFEGLSNEKKQRIIDACMEEFGLNGYERASTNSIVKKAGISKGALFNYFGNKKNLFLYLFDFSIEGLTNNYIEVKDTQPTDLFERFVWYSLLKIKVYLKEPSMSRLVVSAVTNIPEELKEDIEERVNSLYANHVPWLFEDLDISNFKEGVDPQKALKLVSIFIEGIFNKYLKTYKDRPADEIFNEIEKIIKEYNEYLEMLKYGIYKSPIAHIQGMAEKL